MEARSRPRIRLISLPRPAGVLRTVNGFLAVSICTSNLALATSTPTQMELGERGGLSCSTGCILPCMRAGRTDAGTLATVWIKTPRREGFMLSHGDHHRGLGR